MSGSATGPGEAVMLSVEGELDLATADSLYQRALEAIDGHARLLLLDLTGVSFCDACGLSAFIRIAKDADAASCRYGLVAPRPNVARILRITGLDTWLHVFTSSDQMDADRHLEQLPGTRHLEVRRVVLPGSRAGPGQDTDRGQSADRKRDGRNQGRPR